MSAPAPAQASAPDPTAGYFLLTPDGAKLPLAGSAWKLPPRPPPPAPTANREPSPPIDTEKRMRPLVEDVIPPNQPIPALPAELLEREFANREKIPHLLNLAAIKAGFTVSKSISRPDGYSQLACWRGGAPRSAKGPPKNTTKTNCPYRISVTVDRGTGLWGLNVLEPTHNHLSDDPLAMPTARRMSWKPFESDIHALRSAGAPPRAILKWMRTWGAWVNETDIHNVIALSKPKEEEEKSKEKKVRGPRKKKDKAVEEGAGAQGIGAEEGEAPEADAGDGETEALVEMDIDPALVDEDGQDVPGGSGEQTADKDADAADDAAYLQRVTKLVTQAAANDADADADAEGEGEGEGASA